MAFIWKLCEPKTAAGQAKDIFEDTSEASEIQLNALEFRNFRCAMDVKRQRLVESIVNHWCSMLVRGKSMRMDGRIVKCFLDKDLLTFYKGPTSVLLKNLESINFSRDDDQYSDAPYLLELVFETSYEDEDMCFAFETKRMRLNFALTLRILRARDPTLDPNFELEVSWDDGEKPRPLKFESLTTAYQLHPEKGFPVVFSVADVKVLQKLSIPSRTCFLEVFVQYPSQDKYLYAKSHAIELPSAVVQTDEMDERRKKRVNKADLEKRRPIGQLKFEMRNVKLKLPKVPHEIFGRLVSKDEFFPAAVGTFRMDVAEDMFVDRSGGGRGPEREPEALTLSIMSASPYSVWDRDTRSFEMVEKSEHIEIAKLTLRVIGYFYNTE